MEVGAEIQSVVVKRVAERKKRVVAAAAARNGLAYQMCYMFEWETSMQLPHPAAVDVVLSKKTKRESSIEESYLHQTKTRHY